MPATEQSRQIALLQAHNDRLRRLLDQRDAPAELRHRLNNTLAMLRVIIKKSAESRSEMEEYVAHLEDRVDALARAQSAADQHGWVDLRTLVVEEFQFYRVAEGDDLVLSGPPVKLQPRAGQVLGLAIHELTVNALEHGALGSAPIRVDWKIDTDPEDGRRFTLDWIETQDPRPHERGPAGFGTEILTKTLQYELDATTFFAFEAPGLRCRISFPLTERVGVIGRE